MTVTCTHCGAAFEAQRRTARYCSPRCKKAAQRARVAAEGATVVPLDFLGPIEKAARNELEQADTLASVPGQVALVLARLMDRAGPAQGSAIASWSKELGRVLGEAAARQPRQPDVLDEIRARVRGKSGPRPVQ